MVELSVTATAEVNRFPSQDLGLSALSVSAFMICYPFSNLDKSFPCLLLTLFNLVVINSDPMQECAISLITSYSGNNASLPITEIVVILHSKEAYMKTPPGSYTSFLSNVNYIV